MSHAFRDSKERGCDSRFSLGHRSVRPFTAAVRNRCNLRDDDRIWRLREYPWVPRLDGWFGPRVLGGEKAGNSDTDAGGRGRTLRRKEFSRRRTASKTKARDQGRAVAPQSCDRPIGGATCSLVVIRRGSKVSPSRLPSHDLEVLEECLDLREDFRHHLLDLIFELLEVIV